MNKGIKIAKGEFILFLNSGDWLYEKRTLTNVSKLVNNDCNIFFGDAIFKFPKKDKLVKYNKRISFEFFTTNNFCHQSTFIKRKLFDEIFYYNESLKIVSDWEFFIYAICSIANSSYKIFVSIAIFINFLFA